MSEFIDDPALMFPRKRKPEKNRAPMQRSRIKAKPQKYQKGSIPEEQLQNFADEEAVRLGLDSNHVPQSIYSFLISDSLVIDEEIKSFLKKHFFGRPDCELRKNIEGTDFQLVFQAELKTDSKQAKLTARQREYLRGTNFGVLRSKTDIKEKFKEFCLFLEND